MDIQKMHELFRTLGQQMGLQNIRAILPSSIDNYLNVAITEYIKTVISSNVNTSYGDKVTTQNNSISPVNSLRTLYKEDTLEVVQDSNSIELNLNISNLMSYISFAIIYSDTSGIYKCRLIEPDKVETTLNDYCNRASYDSPIAYLVHDGNSDILNIIIDKDKSYSTKSVKVKYYCLPAIVKYDSDISNCINCDLPEHTHKDIVELAVNKFFQSVGSTAHSVN